MDEEIALDKVWMVDTLHLSQGSPPAEEDRATTKHFIGRWRPCLKVISTSQ